MGQKIWGHTQRWPSASSSAIKGKVGSDSGHPPRPGRADVTLVKCYQLCCGSAQGYTVTLALGVNGCLPGCCSWIMSLGAKTRPWALTPTLTWRTWKELR